MPDNEGRSRGETLERLKTGKPGRNGKMENMDCLVKYVEEKGNLDVMQIGAFMQWKTKTGESRSASVSQIHEEWSRGR